MIYSYTVQRLVAKKSFFKEIRMFVGSATLHRYNILPINTSKMWNSIIKKALSNVLELDQQLTGRRKTFLSVYLTNTVLLWQSVYLTT